MGLIPWEFWEFLRFSNEGPKKFFCQFDACNLYNIL